MTPQGPGRDNITDVGRGLSFGVRQPSDDWQLVVWPMAKVSERLCATDAGAQMLTVLEQPKDVERSTRVGRERTAHCYPVWVCNGTQVTGVMQELLAREHKRGVIISPGHALQLFR